MFLQRSERVRASLGAVELLGRTRVDPRFEVAPGAAPFLEAGRWFDALDGLRGDPGYSAAELARAPGDSGSFADDTLVRAGGLALGPADQGAEACERPWSATTGRVPATGIRVRAKAGMPLTISARRFGEKWVMVGVLPIAPGRAVRLRPLPDASGLPYVVRAQGAQSICPL